MCVWKSFLLKSTVAQLNPQTKFHVIKSYNLDTEIFCCLFFCYLSKLVLIAFWKCQKFIIVSARLIHFPKWKWIKLWENWIDVSKLRIVLYIYTRCKCAAAKCKMKDCIFGKTFVLFESFKRYVLFLSCSFFHSISSANFLDDWRKRTNSFYCQFSE